MLSELKFVQGAVARKDLLPAMTHFAIENGFVRAYNGKLALCAPIAFNIDCRPKAEQLINAICQCDDTIHLSMSNSGRLRVASGDFKAFVDCLSEGGFDVQPEGERVDFDGARFIEALKAVEPFISEDASRLWATGVLFKDESVFATNNVIAVQYWVGTKVPFTVNIPRSAVDELLRINEAPLYAQVTETSMTFHYLDKRWVRTQLLGLEWPDIVQILNKDSNAQPVDPRLFEGLQKIKKFTDKFGRVYIEKGTLRTAGGADVDEGARYDIPGLAYEGIYNINMLLLLKDIATHVDFTHYPQPCLFFGGQLRGAIVGLKM
jgi:DNA polymerase III sliding clamp (beta) subunit (PCNA family)